MDKQTNFGGAAKSRPGDRLGFVGHVFARRERFLGRFFGQTDNPKRKPDDYLDLLFNDEFLMEAVVDAMLTSQTRLQVLIKEKKVRRKVGGGLSLPVSRTVGFQ